MKKILTLICTLLCANVLLAQVGTELYDSYYSLYYSITSMNPPEVKIIDHGQNSRIYEIPSQITYNGQIYTVTAIGEDALSRKRGDDVIYSPFIIPNSITSIENGAFSGQSLMTYITIPNSVTSIGGGVFSGCTRLTSVTLSNNITSLPSYYRYGTEYGFFEGCDSLTSITIPNSVTSIGNNAFRNCSSLTSVTCLTETAPTIGSNVFEYTPDTKTLIVACGLDYSSWEDSTTWANIQYTDLDIFRIGNLRYEKISNTEVKIIDCNDSVTEIIIPLSVEQCGISYNVTSIGSGAFANCSFLQNVTCLATTPPTLADNTVFPYPNIATLTVPCGSLEAYSAPTSFWNMFFMGRISEDGYEVVANVNNDAFGSVAIENNCSTATLTANANACYQFVGWNDGNTENPRLVTLSSDTTLTANFEVMVVNNDITATICEGQVYNENGFNVSEAGTYTQTLQTANGCDSIVTLVVTTYPTFDTTINATINAGETYAEFGFNESEAGTYVQNLQTEAGCDSTITLVLSVNSSLLDIEETEITFYPNPTDSKVNFSQAIEKVEVIDLTGKVIFTFTNAKTINIESLPSGAYYLRLTNDEKTIMQKVIKQ